MNSFVKSLAIVIIGIVCLIFAAQIYSGREPGTTDNVRAIEIIPKPEVERALIAAVNKARDSYRVAANEMAKGATRPARASEICSMLGSIKVKDWTGSVYKLSSNSEGKGVLSVAIGAGIYMTTWNNSLSDLGDHTLIEPNSQIYAKAVALKTGLPVKFSGSFIPNSLDCIREGSLSLSGSLTEPEFIFRFSDIEALP